MNTTRHRGPRDPARGWTGEVEYLVECGIGATRARRMVERRMGIAPRKVVQGRALPARRGIATRSARTTTSRRTTAHTSRVRRSDADDGGGEPPEAPAPLGAEGRATGGAPEKPGPWLAPSEMALLEREMAQRARRLSRRLQELREIEEGWA